MFSGPHVFVGLFRKGIFCFILPCSGWGQWRSEKYPQGMISCLSPHSPLFGGQESPLCTIRKAEEKWWIAMTMGAQTQSLSSAIRQAPSPTLGHLFNCLMGTACPHSWCPLLWLPVTFSVPSEKTCPCNKYDHRCPAQGTSFPHSSALVL